MKLALTLACAATVAACHPRASAPPTTAAVPALPASARPYGAARWLPAHPTYALLARSVRDAHRAAGEPFDARLLGTLGLDLEGGLAVFSEAVNPTLVVHLAAPAETRRFLAGLGGDAPVVVDGVEVHTIALPAGARAAWAIDADWLWLHLVLPRTGETGHAWLAPSRRPATPAWANDWQWALESGTGRDLVGFADLRGLIAAVSARVPAAAECGALLAPVGRGALAIGLDGGRASARASIELAAPAALSLTRAILPPPGGWAAVARAAPLAAQWNLDLGAVRAWLAPCGRVLGRDELDMFGIAAKLDETGIRTARAIVQHYDASERMKSRGLVSVDLAHRRFFASRLGKIPGRSMIERSRTFGPHRGSVLSIPFGPTLEYVLEDRLALAALGGDGLLASVVGDGPAASAPLFALDVAPPAMARASWAALLAPLELSADRLFAWRELHLVVGVEPERLVIELRGQRQ